MIGLISDVHGNYPALAAVLQELDALGCKTIVSLGDVAGYYCMVNECIDVLRARQVVNLVGNHDSYLIGEADCQRSHVVRRCIAYQSKVITAENRRWLEQSKRSLTIGEARMVHGGWKDPVDEYLYKLRGDYFESRDGHYFFSGHTHVQVVCYFGDKLYCNPGSVGQPRDGDPRAAFAIFDGENVSLYRVPYDFERISNEMRIAGFEDYFSTNLASGTRIGGALSKVAIEGED